MKRIQAFANVRLWTNPTLNFFIVMVGSSIAARSPNFVSKEKGKILRMFDYCTVQGESADVEDV